MKTWWGHLAGRIVEIQHNIVMKRRLISFQGEGVVAALIHDLPSDGALTAERVGDPVKIIAAVRRGHHALNSIH